MNKIKVIFGWVAKIHKEATTNFLVMNTELLYLLPSDEDILREKREINDIGNTQKSYFMFRFKHIKGEYEQPVFGKIVNVESRCENMHHSIRVILRLSLTKDEFEKAFKQSRFSEIEDVGKEAFLDNYISKKLVVR